MTMTDEKRKSLLDAAQHWDDLATQQECTPPGEARRKQYRNTALSLRMEARDGIARCSCCLLPYTAKCRR